MANNRLEALLGASDTIKAGDNQLKSISYLIGEEGRLTAEIETATAIVSEAKRQRYDIVRNKLPEAMVEAQLPKLEGDNGVKVELKWDTEGSLGSPKTKEEYAERDAKLDLIEKHGGDEIIKMVVAISFPKGMFGDAAELEESLRKTLTETGLTEKGVLVYRERTVNHQSLMKWIRDRMEADEVTDRLPLTLLERLGIWYGRVAKIKRPKEN
jgi:hypothetical protein